VNFLESNCSFKPFTSELIVSSNLFECDNSDLNDFFLNDCVNYSKELLGKTYCFTLDSDDKDIVCAFTISNDSIKVSNLPGARKTRI
jgi:hypothetical protein